MESIIFSHLYLWLPLVISVILNITGYFIDKKWNIAFFSVSLLINLYVIIYGLLDGTSLAEMMCVLLVLVLINLGFMLKENFKHEL